MSCYPTLRRSPGAEASCWDAVQSRAGGLRACSSATASQTGKVNTGNGFSTAQSFSPSVTPSATFLHLSSVCEADVLWGAPRLHCRVACWQIRMTCDPRFRTVGNALKPLWLSLLQVPRMKSECRTQFPTYLTMRSQILPALVFQTSFSLPTTCALE